MLWKAIENIKLHNIILEKHFFGYITQISAITYPVETLALQVWILSSKIYFIQFFININIGTFMFFK